MNRLKGQIMTKSNHQDALAGLKDFQRKTVDFVFKRLYGKSPTRRYLVADEVGLGKTLVARGVIAKTIDYLRHDKSIKRIDVVYICSNVSIATQNIERLNVEGSDDGFTLATRMTYLPVQVKDLQKKDVTFISLTPRTTFDHSASRGGTMRERAILYHMLYNLPWAHGKRRQTYRMGLLNLLQGKAGKQSWRDTKGWYHLASNHYKDTKSKEREKKIQCKFCIDDNLGIELRKEVRKDADVYNKLKVCADSFKRFKKNTTYEDRELRYSVIGKLRKLLAHTCVTALEPDLVIMDEFQRFKDLLGGKSEAASLAEAVFNYGDARVLLLSATPYKMLTMNNEVSDENHYQEFLETLKFLYQSSKELEAVQSLLSRWRYAILSNQMDSDEIKQLKRDLEKQLLKVMCRTERVKFTKEFDAMMAEDSFQNIEITPQDIGHACFIDKISMQVDGGDIREYWKSAPYLLNFLKHYSIRRNLDKIIDREKPTTDNQLSDLTRLLNKNQQHLLKETDIKSYRYIKPGNARLRALIDDTIGKGMWKYIWIPPSLPYSKLSGVYKNSGDTTKSVIFSNWNAVPDAISTLCSYEAERKMVEGTDRSEEYYREVSTPLTYSKKSDRQMVLTWVIPFPTLAEKIDPLLISLKHGNHQPIHVRELFKAAKAIARELISGLKDYQSHSRRDPRWYWVAPFLLENETYRKWLLDLVNNPQHRKKGENFWPGLQSQVNHMIEIMKEFENTQMTIIEKLSTLGTFPTDLSDVLASIALGAPATCTYRSFRRITDHPVQAGYDPSTLKTSFQVANGFRTIFNSPEVVSMISKQIKGRTYLRKTLKYAIDGNLQATLDEYVHTLADTPNLKQKTHDQRMNYMANMFQSVLSIRSAQISVDNFVVDKKSITRDDFPIRTRFALRYRDFKEDKKETITRATTVKDAFNSPFRPFILASTSIGQEGLDFHVWCHSIIHWNLPANPVDLEQREGRIHRYKGHAIRKNVAEIFGFKALSKYKGDGDPWEIIFTAAREANKDQPELIPYWIFDQGKTKIQRRLPILPFSKEESRIDYLKRCLAIYRLVFGQPRQEDLMSKFEDPEHSILHFKDHLISLEPPPR